MWQIVHVIESIVHVKLTEGIKCFDSCVLFIDVFLITFGIKCITLVITLVKINSTKKGGCHL